MFNVDLPGPVPDFLLWTAAGAFLVIAAVLVLRRYRGRRESPETVHRGAPDILMPVADRALHGRLARLTGYHPATHSRMGIVFIIFAVAAFVGVTVVIRGLAQPSAQPPARPRDAPREFGGDTGEEPVAITGSQVAVDSATGERLILWSGDGQVGSPGRQLDQLLGVAVTDKAGRPVVGREVVFTVAPGGGTLEFNSAVTGESGLATTWWRLGQDPNALSVSAALAERPEIGVEFTASFEAAPPVSPPSTDRIAAAEPATPAPSETAAEVDTTTVDAEPGSTSPAVVVAPRGISPWAVGGIHTCRVNGAGGISCWGSSSAVPGSRALESVIGGVAAGVFHVCGITVQSTIGCWAVGGAGREGLTGERRLPEGAVPEELAVGSEHVCARSSNGRVFCWGRNDRSQLGTGTAGGSQSQPTLVSQVDDVARLASGWFHTCALTGHGRLLCWGANGAGQLGTGSKQESARPAPVDQTAPFRDLAAGSLHTCALDLAGAAWCWGDNQYGQLGVPEVTGASTPTRVETDQRFMSITAGAVHTCGLTVGGRAWCWGRNTFGQLGNGSNRDARVPVQVGGQLIFTRLAAGGSHTCGETTAGQFYCWGNNIQGQIGDGTRENRDRPVRVAGGGQP